jgi:drug/metabolite transporter (DMT)-like permease
MALAIVFALLAATGWGVSAIFARAGLQHMRSNTGTVISLASGVLMIGALALLIYGGDILAFPAVALLWFAALGVINYPLGRLLNYTGVHMAGVGRAAPILSTAPLVAVTLGILVGGESINLPIASGTLAIFAGVVLIVSQRSG